jgi:hypothetical protein
MLDNLKKELPSLSSDDERRNIFISYFKLKYEKLKGFFAPFRTLKMDTNDDNIPILMEDTGSGYSEINLDTSENPEDYLIYSLGFIYISLENDNNSGINVVINQFLINNNFLTNDNLGSVTSTKIEEIIITIKKILRQFIIINNYRIESDSSYKGTYINDIIEAIELYEYNINIFLNIRNKTIEEIKEDESYSLLFSGAQDIRNKINTLLDETIKSVKEINNFFENYSVFLKLPEDTIVNIEKTLNEILPNFVENLSEEDKEYFTDNITSENMIPLDPEQPNIKIFIDEMINMVSSEQIIFQYKDLTNLIILYLGLQLLSKNSTYTNYGYINYALYNIVNKKIIIDSQINVAFDSIKKLEQDLAEKYNIYVRKNINEEFIQSSLKNLIKKLRIIDLVDMNILLDYNIGYTDSNFETTETYYNLYSNTWREYTDN